jgi:hypothetical protein
LIGQSGRVATDQFTRLLDFVRRLDEAHFWYRLTSIRAEAVCVEIAVPGERWEVEFMEDGEIEIERFRSNGEIANEQSLEVLFTDFAD